MELIHVIGYYAVEPRCHRINTSLLKLLRIARTQSNLCWVKFLCAFHKVK